jgi:CHASE3 domain sensor protein
MSVYVGFALLLAPIAAIFVFTSQQAQLFDQVQQGIQQRRSLVKINADLLDAETGQRGYLLTSDRSYLDPYLAGAARIDGDFKALSEVAGGVDPNQLGTLRKLVDEKLTELRTTIELHDAGRNDETLALVNDKLGAAARRPGRDAH